MISARFDIQSTPGKTIDHDWPKNMVLDSYEQHQNLGASKPSADGNTINIV